MEPRTPRFLNDGNDLGLTFLTVISSSLGMASGKEELVVMLLSDPPPSHI